MCLILFAYRHHPDFPLIVAANRDEFYRRPTRPPQFWQEHPAVFAGKDLQAGGTWMGVTRQGRFAAITNYRKGIPEPVARPSRGELCVQFLTAESEVDSFLTSLATRADSYAGFNLLVGDFSNLDKPKLGYFSNRSQSDALVLGSGVYGLSNGLLDEAWPKVELGKQALTAQLNDEPQEIQFVLMDRTTAAWEQLPDTGIEKTLEKQLSSRFIVTDNYGTRSSSVMRIHRSGQVDWLDQSFGPQGAISDHRSTAFSLVVSNK